MTTHLYCSIKIKILTVVFLLLCLATPVLAAPVRVAILPFEINADKDLTFLQEGILDMLGSRLTWRDKVTVINKNETKAALKSVEGFYGESLALLVGGKLQADHVLFGSLTVFGESVSIDAKMVDVTGQQPPLPFYVQTSSMGEVIPQINQFATNINTTVFGRGVAKPTAPASPPPSQAATPAPAPQAAAVPSPPAKEAPAFYDPRMHPEKMLEAGMPTDPPTAAGTAADGSQVPNPLFVPATQSGQVGTFWKSRNFKALITGLEVADADADGRMDLIVVTDKLVSTYQMQNNRLVKTADAAKTSQSAYISVDAADANGNGTPELYITSLASKRTTVDSFVLEYTGGTYQPIGDNDNWFYRVAKTPGRGTLILGQRQRFGEDTIFNGPVNEMRWEGDRLVPGRQILPGRKTNLMGVAVGDITHTGGRVLAAYNDKDRLRLYGEGGQMIWEDADRTGGDMLFYNLPQEQPQDRQIQYFPMRVRVTDIDRDGNAEVMIVRHDELAKGMLKELRQLKKGKLTLLEWNGLGLATKWETEELTGRISDFAIGDVDSDGVDELVVAVVTKEGRLIFTDTVTILIMFDLK